MENSTTVYSNTETCNKIFCHENLMRVIVFALSEEPGNMQKAFTPKDGKSIPTYKPTTQHQSTANGGYPY